MVDHQVVGAGAGIGGGGSEFVCAESKFSSESTPGHVFQRLQRSSHVLRTGDAMTGECHTDVTFLDALSICADVGARLCTLPEIQGREAEHTASGARTGGDSTDCQHTGRVWTSSREDCGFAEVRFNPI